MEDFVTSRPLALTWNQYHCEHDDNDHTPTRSGEIEVFKATYDPTSGDFTVLIRPYFEKDEVKLLTSSTDGLKTVFRKWLKRYFSYDGRLILLDGQKEIFSQFFSDFDDENEEDPEKYKLLEHKIKNKICKTFDELLIILQSVRSLPKGDQDKLKSNIKEITKN